MTYDETVKVLSVLKAAYPHSFKGMTKRDAEGMITLWETMFKADPYEAVNAAVGALIATRTTGYSPTVGEVKEQMQRVHEATTLSEQAAWSLVSKACANGLYGYKKEFAKLPEEVQRAVGAPEQLKEWASMDSETVQSVVASNFMRNYRTQAKREHENAMLPPDIRKMISGVADGMRMLEK